MNDVKEEVLPIFLYLSRNRKSPSNEGLYSDQCVANRVQQYSRSNYIQKFKENSDAKLTQKYFTTIPYVQMKC